MTQVAFSSSFKRAFKKRIERRKDLEQKFWRRVEIFTVYPHDSRPEPTSCLASCANSGVSRSSMMCAWCFRFCRTTARCSKTSAATTKFIDRVEFCRSRAWRGEASRRADPMESLRWSRVSELQSSGAAKRPSGGSLKRATMLSGLMNTLRVLARPCPNGPPRRELTDGRAESAAVPLDPFCRSAISRSLSGSPSPFLRRSTRRPSCPTRRSWRDRRYRRR